MTRREENKVLIRQRLLKEAQRLFSEQGFEQTTVADIVAAAQIGRGTFYNYFSDVKSIFDAVLDQMNGEIKVLIKTARKEATTLYDLLYVSFKTYIDYVSSEKLKAFHRKNYDYIRSTSYTSEVVRQIIRDLQEDLKEKKEMFSYEKEYELKLLSLVLVSTPAELFLNINLADFKISNEELATFLAKLFTNGLDK